MLLSDIITIPEPIEINGDNQGAISLVKNPIISTRSKHIDVKHHFVRKTYAAKCVRIRKQTNRSYIEIDFDFGLGPNVSSLLSALISDECS